MAKNLLSFVSHEYNCDFTQPMWHKGPCDCGLHELLDLLINSGLRGDQNCLDQLYRLAREVPHIIESWENYHKNKKLLPVTLYRCRRCNNPTAEKQDDIQGWDGFCHVCGMIGQVEVGSPVFTRETDKSSNFIEQSKVAVEILPTLVDTCIVCVVGKTELIKQIGRIGIRKCKSCGVECTVE